MIIIRNEKLYRFLRAVDSKLDIVESVNVLLFIGMILAALMIGAVVRSYLWLKGE